MNTQQVYEYAITSQYVNYLYQHVPKEYRNEQIEYDIAIGKLTHFEMGIIPHPMPLMHSDEIKKMEIKNCEEQLQLAKDIYLIKEDEKMIERLALKIDEENNKK